MVRQIEFRNKEVIRKLKNLESLRLDTIGEIATSVNLILEPGIYPSWNDGAHMAATLLKKTALEAIMIKTYFQEAKDNSIDLKDLFSLTEKDFKKISNMRFDKHGFKLEIEESMLKLFFEQRKHQASPKRSSRTEERDYKSQSNTL